MGPALTIVLIPAVLIIGGFGVALLTAPHSVNDPFEIHAPGGTSWLNVSDSFSGTGSLEMSWYAFSGLNATLAVYACHATACGPSERSLVYTDSAPLYWAPDVVAHGYGPGNYLIVGTNQSWTAFGNVTFEFSPSVYPWAVAVTVYEVAGGVAGTIGIAIVLRTASKL